MTEQEAKQLPKDRDFGLHYVCWIRNYKVEISTRRLVEPFAAKLSNGKSIQYEFETCITETALQKERKYHSVRLEQAIRAHRDCIKMVSHQMFNSPLAEDLVSGVI